MGHKIQKKCSPLLKQWNSGKFKPSSFLIYLLGSRNEDEVTFLIKQYLNVTISKCQI